MSGKGRTQLASMAVMAVALSLSASRLVRAESAADTAAARDLFTDATQLAQAGKLEEARDRFERSLRLKRAGVTFYSLGVVQKRLGLLVEASESLHAFLSEPSLPQTKPFEEPAREAIRELATKLAHLRVSVVPDGAPELQIRVDGQEIPEAARIVPRGVNPGKHRVDVTARGFVLASQIVELREGQSSDLTVTLKVATTPVPGASAAPPPPSPADSKPAVAPPSSAPEPARAPHDGPRVVPIALLAGGGAFLSTGAILGAVGVSQAKGAPTRDGSEASSARTKGVLSDVFGGIGIVAIAVGGYLLLTGSPSEAAPSSASARRVVVWGEGSMSGVRVAF